MNAHQRRVNQRRFERYWKRIEAHVKGIERNAGTGIEFYHPYVLWVPETGMYVDRGELLEGPSRFQGWKSQPLMAATAVRYCFDAHERKSLQKLAMRFPGVTIRKLTAIEYGKRGTVLNRAIKRERKNA